MSLNLVSLNTSNVRALMLQEFNSDVNAGRVYLSPRLKLIARQTYIDLMRNAIHSGDCVSLANNIKAGSCLQSTFQRRKPKGGYTTVKMPSNAHNTLAEGEYNRFYLRAIALYAIENNCEIIAYRAKPVSRPRPESEALIGKSLEPQFLLNDLRVNIGQNPASKMPGGPNSGISGYLKC